MDQQIKSPEDLALKILFCVGGANQELMPFRDQILANYNQITEFLSDYPFDRFTNWNLTLSYSSLSHQDNNYFLANSSPQRLMEHETRINALNRDTLFSIMKQFCQDRYSEAVRSIAVFGGYLYGVTPKPDDLDIAVILKNSYVIENAIVCKYPELANIINYHRKPLNKIGIVVIGDNQLHKTNQNNTVLRTGVILGTTAISLAGEQLAVNSAPISVLLYHAVEMVTWGFKLCFNETAEDSNRALWRIGEALHILNFINRKIRGPIEHQDDHIHFLIERLSDKEKSDKNSSALFYAEALRFKENILLLKKHIRKLALENLEQMCSKID